MVPLITWGGRDSLEANGVLYPWRIEVVYTAADLWTVVAIRVPRWMSEYVFIGRFYVHVANIVDCEGKKRWMHFVAPPIWGCSVHLIYAGTNCVDGEYMRRRSTGCSYQKTMDYNWSKDGCGRDMHMCVLNNVHVMLLCVLCCVAIEWVCYVLWNVWWWHTTAHCFECACVIWTCVFMCMLRVACQRLRIDYMYNACYTHNS